MMRTAEEAIAQIPDAVIRELAQRGHVRTFARNALIIEEGERGDSMYIILTGRVQVYVSDQRGRQMVIDDYGFPDYFGEMALDGSPRSASVRALETVQCAVVDAATLRESLRNPDLALKFIFVLIERARAATESVRGLALSDVYTRFRALLMTLSEESPDGVRRVPMRMTQADFARRVGAQRDMINRICSQLVRGGYLAINEQRYTILRRLPERF